MKSEPVVDVKPDVSEEHLSGEEESDKSFSENDSSNNSENSQHSDSHARTPRRSAKQPLPPGFKEMRTRIQPFGGKKGEEDFHLWLEDYEEATNDCQWSDEVKARWFSWFITGPAKATWQRTLNLADKLSWKQIAEVYKGQYGSHLDPRTAAVS